MSICSCCLLCLFYNGLKTLLENDFLLKVMSLFYRYGSPILDIKWHRTLNSEQPKLITTDNHVVRIWDPETVSGRTEDFGLLTLLFTSFPSSFSFLNSCVQSILPAYLVVAYVSLYWL